MSPPDPWLPLLHWLWLVLLIAFAHLVLVEAGLLLELLWLDSTRISALTLLVFWLACGHCGYRAWWLSRQRIVAAWPGGLMGELEGRVQKSSGIVSQYQRMISSGTDSAIAAEWLAEQAKGNHQAGWFTVGILLKLGLLGTVVGFILMLSSVSGFEDLDTSDIQQLMQQMTSGMGVAMNTTLVGLVSSMMLGLQYLMLDRAADALVADALVAFPADDPLRQDH